MTRVFAASFVVATGVFGAWILTTPVSEAAVKPGIDVSQIEFSASKNMPSLISAAYPGAGHPPLKRR
jgi:hypothetical protein